jgi:hypothetical protein
MAELGDIGDRLGMLNLCDLDPDYQIAIAFPA